MHTFIVKGSPDTVILVALIESKLRGPTIVIIMKVVVEKYFKNPFQAMYTYYLKNFF
jgi:hypothetical protein